MHMLVTPLPGVPSQLALDRLKEEHRKVTNVRGTGGLVTDLYNAYIEWCVNAIGQLRHVVSNHDLERLVMTRRYWLLQSLPNDHNTLRSVIDLELHEREITIGAAIASMQAQIAHWQLAGVFVVADTSVYIRDSEKLEFLPFSSRLDLRHEPIHVLVPIVVIDELDNLKRASDKHVRWRAGYTLSVIDRVLGSGGSGLLQQATSVADTTAPPRGSVSIEVVLDPPDHVRLAINDDEIIDRALAIRALSGRDVRLLTYDTGMATRSRFHALPVTKLTRDIGPEPAAP